MKMLLQLRDDKTRPDETPIVDIECKKKTNIAAQAPGPQPRINSLE